MGGVGGGVGVERGGGGGRAVLLAFHVSVDERSKDMSAAASRA